MQGQDSPRALLRATRIAGLDERYAEVRGGGNLLGERPREEGACGYVVRRARPPPRAVLRRSSPTGTTPARRAVLGIAGYRRARTGGGRAVPDRLGVALRHGDSRQSAR